MRHVIKTKIVCLCVSRNFKRNKIHDGLFGYILAEYHKTSSLFDLNFGVSCCDLHSTGSLTRLFFCRLKSSSVDKKMDSKLFVKARSFEMHFLEVHSPLFVYTNLIMYQQQQQQKTAGLITNSKINRCFSSEAMRCVANYKFPLAPQDTFSATFCKKRRAARALMFAHSFCVEN
jgi:hypothetical protein